MGKINKFELVLSMVLEYYTSVVKGLKLKFRKSWELILTFVEVTGKNVIGAFLPPIENRVKSLPDILINIKHNPSPNLVRSGLKVFYQFILNFVTEKLESNFVSETKRGDIIWWFLLLLKFTNYTTDLQMAYNEKVWVFETCFYFAKITNCCGKKENFQMPLGHPELYIS